MIQFIPTFCLFVVFSMNGSYGGQICQYMPLAANTCTLWRSRKWIVSVNLPPASQWGTDLGNPYITKWSRESRVVPLYLQAILYKNIQCYAESSFNNSQSKNFNVLWIYLYSFILLFSRFVMYFRGNIHQHKSIGYHWHSAYIAGIDEGYKRLYSSCYEKNKTKYIYNLQELLHIR